MTGRRERVRRQMDLRVFQIWGLFRRAYLHPTRFQRCGENESRFRFALCGCAGFLLGLFLGCCCGCELLGEGCEGRVGGVEGQAAGAGVAGFGEFVEGEESGGGAVEGFDVDGVEGEC